MKHWKIRILETLEGFLKALRRFPLSVLAFASLTGLVWYTIHLNRDPDIFVFKLIFICFLAGIMGILIPFVNERRKADFSQSLLTYGIGLLLIGGYSLLIWPSLEVDYSLGSRTVVANFALICAILVVPSWRKPIDFNQVCLVHFKAFFTAFLFAGVLFLGTAAIITAIDVLLIHLDSRTMAYVASTIWMFLAELFYLSFLPRFSSAEAKDIAYFEERRDLPKFLRILVSTIAIPLISIYTLVLVAYFIKIVFTRQCPVGQLGPMILGYSIAGLVLFILSSNLENRIAKGYILVFPKALVLVVLVQMVSIGIRLVAYGFTESRYYLMLFAVYSLSMGIYLSLRKQGHNVWIAILAMGFALFSVLPPLDAFSVSRASQIARLETMLTEAGVLKDGVLVATRSADETLRKETTSIVEYLDQHHQLAQLGWLPESFRFPQDFEVTFGFEPAYGQPWAEQEYFYAGLDSSSSLDITGYDRMVRAPLYRGNPDLSARENSFSVNGLTYTLKYDRLSADDVNVRLLDAQGTSLIETRLFPMVEKLQGISTQDKGLMNLEAMTLDVANAQAKLRIVFQNINRQSGSGTDAGTDYDLMIFVDLP